MAQSVQGEWKKLLKATTPRPSSIISMKVASPSATVAKPWLLSKRHIVYDREANDDADEDSGDDTEEIKVLLGKGGFGEVFRGKYPTVHTALVAVASMWLSA